MHKQDFQDVLTLPTGSPPPKPRRSNHATEITRYDYLFKLIIIGDPSVGKTNLTMRFCDYDFSPHYVGTIGIDFKVKTLEIEGKRVKLQIWDTAGQERFQSISKMYYRGAQGVIFVYDVTHRTSYENVRKWVATYENANGAGSSSSDVVKILLGNKCDDQENRKVSTEAGEAAAKTYNLKYFETSAKSGYNVDVAFYYMTTEILRQLDVERDNSLSPRSVRSNMKKKRNVDWFKRGWSWSACSLL